MMELVPEEEIKALDETDPVKNNGSSVEYFDDSEYEDMKNNGEVKMLCILKEHYKQTSVTISTTESIAMTG